MYISSGLPKDKVVEFHRSISDDHIVGYGQDIPEHCLDMVEEDLIRNVKEVDLIMVMGTSLSVAPFCALPNMVHKDCCRILIDLHPENVYRNSFNSVPYSADMMTSKKNEGTLLKYEVAELH